MGIFSIDRRGLHTPENSRRLEGLRLKQLETEKELVRLSGMLGKPYREKFGILNSDESNRLRLSIPDNWNFVDAHSSPETLEFLEHLSGKVGYAGNCSLLSSAPLASREEHEKLAAALLTEAVAARQSTVPPNAIVEFSIGDFRSVEISEKKDTVYFAWRDADGIGRFICRVKVSGEAFDWEIVSGGLKALQARLRAGFLSGKPADLYDHDFDGLKWLSNFDDDQFSALYFLSAAILRDFWVVEDRSSAFRLGAPRTRRTSGRDRKKIDTVIYLPRCIYSREKVRAAANSDTKIWNVSPHFIRSHFRALGFGHCASVKQRAIASLHGVTQIPEGKTWVRAHVAGHVKDGGLVRYRSRTASRSLFDVIELSKQVTLLDGLNWFQFERLCERLMQERGYRIVDKVGDGGIDILAVNNSGQFALGQAKHWAEKVGPSVVREMIGTRSKFEAEHGVTPISIILSSSGFTFSARSDAAAANIELVDVRSDTT